MGITRVCCIAASRYQRLGQPQSARHLKIGTDVVSPYTGTLGSSANNPLSGNPAIELYCDDFNNGVSSSGWTVNITALSSTGALTNVAGYANNAARFETTSGGLNVPSNGLTFPSASALYDEMVWLFTQMGDPGISNGDKEDIQEAVWFMTGTGTPTTEQSGATKTYLQWINAAQTNYQDTAAQDAAAGYSDPNYGLWEVVTDTANATNKAFGGSSQQEFLAYTATPEPATFVLIGSALLFGAIVARRRKASEAEKA